MGNVLQRLDSTHSRLLELITPLSEESFAQRPAQDEWSVAEIVQHLALVENRVTKDLAAAAEREPRKLGLMRRCVPTSIVAFRLIRVKAPKAVVPESPPEKERCIDALNDARRKLKELYKEQGVERLKQMVFKHPFLGELSGTATISFVAYHEKRHYKQIREVLKKLGSLPISDC